ncbi:alpha/beta fold hydrolase [Acetobacter tropicalis]|uniref:Biotin synthesis protein BioH n=1 Tax=Acetobacter tropicalis TaxID=104102 RepID=A0A094YGY2_9PROT|nr:alpha/beta hydrolase [Acetobacter tropicalis]KGB21250.1 Biotin synthesis protein BioH [Acetobacter tropicalis]MDO8170308.1 alpha/beta hydrolase [Acetobacter tropicalis]
MTALQPVFVHGWACGPQIWQPVLAHLNLPPAHLIDLGYFAKSAGERDDGQILTALEADRPILGVGHSMGLMWLLSQRDWPPGSRFVGINAFGRFASGADFPQGVGPRVLARMQAGLARDAGTVVNSFRARCGMAAVESSTCHVSALQAGLSLLAKGDVRAQIERVVAHDASCMVALAGGEDPIVSASMTKAAFPQDIKIEWQEKGVHMLPLTHPEFCAAHIQKLMKDAG